MSTSVDVRDVDTRPLHELLVSTIRPPAGATMTVTEFEARKSRFAREYPGVIAKMRRQAGLHAVPINGSRARGLKNGYFQTRLADGTVGYLQRRTDDCLQMAIASLLQVAPHTIPDSRIDQRLEAGDDIEQIERDITLALTQWAARQGATITIHTTPPNGRWIGVAPSRGDGAFSDHCLIMNGTTCLFDTSIIVPLNDGDHLVDPATIEYGITIESGDDHGHHLGR